MKSYAQWLREKNLSIKVTSPLTESGVPVTIHNHFKNKGNELYDRNLTRQGKKIEPEDM